MLRVKSSGVIIVPWETNHTIWNSLAVAVADIDIDIVIVAVADIDIDIVPVPVAHTIVMAVVAAIVVTVAVLILFQSKEGSLLDEMALVVVDIIGLAKKALVDTYVGAARDLVS
jgi:hypothetical protein